MSEDPAFADLAGRIQCDAIEAASYVEAATALFGAMARGVDGAEFEFPSFRVAFVLEKPFIAAMEFAGLAVSGFQTDQHTSGLDFTLRIEEQDSGAVSAVAEYDAELFEPATIQLWLRHYETLLAHAISNPEAVISKLPLLAAEERSQLLEEWNATHSEYPANVPLQRLIENQVEKTPDAVALVFKNERLTYAELNARANQLAAHLRSLGVGRNTLVGICLERSLDLMVAPLAIMKAGGAYLPLAPERPDDHVWAIVESAQVNVLIGGREMTARLPKFRGKLVVPDWDVLQSYPAENHPVEVSGSDLAYVIYTSGSTGQPKGVMIPRRALTNLLWSVRDWFRFSPQDVLLALTTIAFDIAGVDLWLPLMAGGRTLVVDRDTTMDGSLLQDLIHREGVTFLQCTPASWKLLIETAWPGKPDLQAICTGEAMSGDLAAKLFPRVGGLWNMYGPTETTIWSTGYKFSSAHDPILIGRPIANTQIYILDQNLDPTPVGVAGELYIGGDGLADGYLARPDLTEQQFVPNPFSPMPGARLYKTGDLARYRSDGNVQCLGRNDDQIKLRGFRIEPEEIRQAITQHPSVRDAVAVLETSATGDRRIVAYLISETGEPPQVTELRSFLRQKLPDYMVPSSFVFVESFPLNGNGKINRRVLSQIKSQVRESAENEAPADQIEARLRDLFRSALGLSSVGVNHDFFDLGGHSLTAAQLFREINACFTLDLPLATLFHAPTVRSIAAVIRNSAGDEMNAPVVPIQPGGERPRLFCIGAVDGELIVFRRLALELGLDQPMFGLQPFRLLNAASSVKQLAEAYIGELRKAGESRPTCLLGYSFGGLVAIEMAHQLQRLGIEPPLVILIDASYPAGCRASESWSQRIERFRQLWRTVSNGGGLSHLLERIKYGSARIAHRTSSTVGVALPSLGSDAGSVQQLASESYRIQSYKGPVHLFRAETQPAFLGGGVSLGWSGVLPNLAIEDVPGDHGTINTGMNLKVLARKVQDCLENSAATVRSARS